MMAKKATLINPAGKKVVVEVDSQESKDFFGQGFQLLGASGKFVPITPTTKVEAPTFYRAGVDIFNADTNQRISETDWTNLWAGKATEVGAPKIDTQKVEIKTQDIISTKDLTEQDSTGIIQDAKVNRDSENKVIDTVDKFGINAGANRAFVEGVAEATGKKIDLALIGKTLGQVMDIYEFSGRLNDFGVQEKFEIPEGYEAISGDKFSTREAQRGAYDDIQRDPTGTFLYGKPKVTDITVDDDGVSKQLTVLDKMNNLMGGKKAIREEAMEAEGIDEITAQRNEAQQKANETFTKIEQMRTDLEAGDILDVEASVALKNKIEGEGGIPMSIINKRLLSGLSDLDQAQRLDRLYTVYELNSQINQYNANLRQIALYNGQYDVAIANVKDTVDDYVEERMLQLQILEMEGMLEKEERTRYESEIEYSRNLAEKGFVLLPDIATRDAIMRDKKITAENYSIFLYDDPGSDNIYVRPQTEDAFVTKSKEMLKTEDPMTINQIEQFRRSYGWTPPFGFTENQVKQYVEDNPGATPEELEAGAIAQMAGETIDTGQFLSEEYFRETFTDDELKEMSDKFGTSSWLRGKKGDIRKFLSEVMTKVETAREEGYLDTATLKYLRE